MRKAYLVEICLATALVLTLAVKVATGFARRNDTIEARWHIQAGIALEGVGFEIDGFLRDRDLPLLSVHKAGCVMLIANVSPLGWHRDVLSKIVRPNEQLFFVYRGTIFQAQPVWRTAAHYHWDRLRSYVGVADRDDSVLGIIAARSCGAIGSDEFGVSLPGASREDIEKVAERIRHSAADVRFEVGGSDWPLSVSVGVVLFETEIDLDDLLRAASQQMQVAKNEGRNRIEYTELRHGPSPSRPALH
jgi:hypothetical protein